MPLNANHVAGFIAGVGVSVAGFYLYKKNQAQVDQFLSEHGIEVSSLTERDTSSMTMKELVKTKEGLEDLIAEREYEAKQAETKA